MLMISRVGLNLKAAVEREKAVFRLKQITTDHIKGSLGSTKFNLSTISPKLASL
jgi:hypothetical protein